jgi:hypothetical protein
MKIFLFTLMLLALATNSFARGTADIVTGAANANIYMAKDSADDYQTRFHVYGSYDRAFATGLQFGGALYADFGSNYSDYSLLVGPGYNFQHNDLENSFFVLARGGIVISKFLGHTSTNGAIHFEGAKRFKILDNVSYVPGIEISKTLGSNTADPTFAFNIFKFSIFF